MKLSKEEVGKKAIEKWGLEKQLDMAVEECSELIKCIVKYRRYDHNKVWELKLIDELVDVEIMLTQLKLILMNDKQYEEQMQSKLERLNAIIGAEDNPYRGLKGEDVGRVIK